MKKILIAISFLALLPLNALHFKDIFLKGNQGDYSIYQNGHSVTILNIHSKEDPFITFEEITLPKNLYETIKGKNLNSWVKNLSPDVTSWTLLEVNLDSLKVTNSYCVSRKTHLSINKEDTLISSLLNLNITTVDEEKLPRIGPRKAEKKDTRPLWKPSMYFFGEKKEPKKMDVYESIWENDGSPLSLKQINLYLLDDFVFPYWIEVTASIGSKKMISIDSGNNLISPIEKITPLPPNFFKPLAPSLEDKDLFSFMIQTSRPLNELSIYLIELGKDSHKLILLDPISSSIEANCLKFDLRREILNQLLISGKKYRLYLSYKEKNEIKSITSKDIIHWK